MVDEPVGSNPEDTDAGPHTTPETPRDEATSQRGESGSASSPLSTPLIAVAMVIGAALAWVVAVYVPSPFVLPEHLVGVDMYSPPELQQELAEKEDEIYWKSGLFHLVLMGLCFGVVPLFMAIGGGTDKPAVPAIAGLVSGAVFGAAAFGVGHVMRTYANNAEQGLQGDMLVFILVGILLSLPVTVGVLAMGRAGGVQRAIGAPLAALVSGLLLPIIASFALPEANTTIYPPEGPLLIGLWFGMLAVLAALFMSAVGSREPKRSPGEAAQAAA